MRYQARHPKGIKKGGQYSPHRKSEPSTDVNLTDDDFRFIYRTARQKAASQSELFKSRFYIDPEDLAQDVVLEIIKYSSKYPGKLKMDDPGNVVGFIYRATRHRFIRLIKRTDLAANVDRSVRRYEERLGRKMTDEERNSIAISETNKLYSVPLPHESLEMCDRRSVIDNMDAQRIYEMIEEFDNPSNLVEGQAKRSKRTIWPALVRLMECPSAAKGVIGRDKAKSVRELVDTHGGVQSVCRKWATGTADEKASRALFLPFHEKGAKLSLSDREDIVRVLTSLPSARAEAAWDSALLIASSRP